MSDGTQAEAIFALFEAAFYKKPFRIEQSG